MQHDTRLSTASQTLRFSSAADFMGAQRRAKGKARQRDKSVAEHDERAAHCNGEQDSVKASEGRAI
jgi:hypothetical protein